MTTVTTIGLEAVIGADLRNGTGESPVWDTQARCWSWIDIPGRAVHRFDPATGALDRWSLEEMPGCVALRPDGGLVCGCETGVFDVDLPAGGGAAVMTRLATVQMPKPGMRFNDGRCDRQGRLWASSMVMDAAQRDGSGAWYRFGRGAGLSGPLLTGFWVPNGSAFSPDGRIFYLADSQGDVRTVWAFDYDPDAGLPHNRRVFVDLRGTAGRPDGAAVDVDGCYWICCLDEGCIKRFTPQGVLDRRIDVPMRKPTMCAFGGEDMRTMLVTSLSRGPEDLAGDPHGGRVVLFRPGAQGIHEPRLLA